MSELEKKGGFFPKIKQRVFPKKRKTLSVMEEEQVYSPFKTMMINFISKKLTKIALFMYCFILLACLILPLFFPADLTASDSTQMNIKPGFTFMKVPDSLKNNAALIDAGANYGAGIDKSGKLYLWGNLSDRLKQVPAGMGTVKSVSAGFDHVLALNEEGDVFTWGSIKFGLDAIPPAVAQANIVQVVAGYQISFALDDTGNMYIWGNENLVSVNTSLVQSSVRQIESNISTVVVLQDDGTVVCLSRKESSLLNIPEAIQGKVVDIAITDKSGAAVLEDGTVSVWGLNDYDIYNIPEDIQGHTIEITAGTGHFTALLDDGTVVSWGLNSDKQANAPGASDIVFIDSDYKANYAIDSAGNVYSWGLKGYLMGTDHMGRDVFSRLLAGGRISLTVGILSVVIAAVIGISLGGISGYAGGKVDIIIMRITEVFQAIPFLPVAIILSHILGSSITQFQRVFMIMAIQGLLSWPAVARLVRGQILSARENEYVTAAKAMGVRENAIIFKHIFPNILGSILVNLTLRLATAIIYESTLSFIGFGIVEPVPTWGNMLNGSMDSRVIANYWWRWLFPAFFLSASTLSIYMIGDGLSEAVDPKNIER